MGADHLAVVQDIFPKLFGFQPNRLPGSSPPADLFQPLARLYRLFLKQVDPQAVQDLIRFSPAGSSWYLLFRMEI